MSTVDAPDLFALRAEIAGLTAQAAQAAKELEPLIAAYRRVGDAVADLADAQAGTDPDAVWPAYQDWRQLSGYEALNDIMLKLQADLDA